MDSHPPVRRTLLATTAAGWLALALPCPVRAQGPAPRALRIGVLSVSPRNMGTRLGAALAEYGYIEDKNLTFEVRSADGDSARLPGLAAVLVQRKVDVILTFTTADTRAARQATSTIPIIMYGVGGDPVASGLVASLARPGGNISGFISMTAEMGVKRLELLKELMPGLKKAALLGDARMTEATRNAVRAAAAKLQVELAMMDIRNEADIVAAFADMGRRGIQAVTNTGSPLLRDHADLIPRLALQHRVAWASGGGDADRGALLAYSPDMSHVAPRAAYLIDRIARGAKPGDLPVEQPTRFTLTVNPTTAKALGIKLPPAFMTRVDRTVE
jgi:putative tryptophan/tyrosine transport system substrate-binding protein